MGDNEGGAAAAGGAAGATAAAAGAAEAEDPWSGLDDTAKLCFKVSVRIPLGCTIKCLRQSFLIFEEIFFVVKGDIMYYK